jgi:hypothetical protein
MQYGYLLLDIAAPAITSDVLWISRQTRTDLSCCPCQASQVYEHRESHPPDEGAGCADSTWPQPSTCISLAWHGRACSCSEATGSTVLRHARPPTPSLARSHHPNPNPSLTYKDKVGWAGRYISPPTLHPSSSLLPFLFTSTSSVVLFFLLGYGSLAGDSDPNPPPNTQLPASPRLLLFLNS